jgi:23S rRNA (pseudouridine1915-N3)-methyltransferase
MTIAISTGPFVTLNLLFVNNFQRADWLRNRTVYEKMENDYQISSFLVEPHEPSHLGGILLSMEFVLAHIGSRTAGDTFQRETEVYLKRASAFLPCQPMAFRKEEDLLAWLNSRQGRIPPVAVLLDSRGRQMRSEAFASWIGERRDQGARHIVFAVGPADGWSDQARGRAQLLLSLSPLTMAHALARLVLAEQLYRACTILAGHPYHTGH